MRAPIDYDGDLNHTNDGSVIERRWASNMEAVKWEQMQAFTAQIASSASAKKHKARAEAGADNPGDSIDESESSKDS